MKFAGSYSRLKNFESCPKRHYNYDLAPWNDRVRDSQGEALAEGIRVHDALAQAVIGREPLPPEMQEYERYIEALHGGEGELMVEKNFAIDAEFKACMYKSPKVFWRMKIDVIKHKGRVAVVWDWKTGKRKVEEDQLFLSAAGVFAHLPEVQAVSAAFIWLNDDVEDIADAITSMWYRRDKMAEGWAQLMPRIDAMRKAYETEDFPPTPCGLCRSYCGVTSCIYHGKGGR